MEHKLFLLRIKYWHTLIVACVFALAYIGVDDNNIVSANTQRVFYIAFWVSVLVTVILLVRRKQ